MTGKAQEDEGPGKAGDRNPVKQQPTSREYRLSQEGPMLTGPLHGADLLICG